MMVGSRLGEGGWTEATDEFRLNFVRYLVVWWKSSAEKADNRRGRIVMLHQCIAVTIVFNVGAGLETSGEHPKGTESEVGRLR